MPQATIPPFAKIQRALEAQIMSGAWQPGHRVPKEHELLKQYGCSRMTVSKALTALAAAGLIVRKRRSGSFVASRVLEEAVLEIHDTQAEIHATGKLYSYEILSRRFRAITRKDVKRFGLTSKAKVLALVVLHFAGDQPFVLEDRIFNLAVVPDAAQEKFKHTPPGSWLLKRIPWTNTEHVISASSVSGKLAERLSVANGTACLVVERKTWQLGVPVTFVRLTYPGKLFRLIGRFQPAPS